MLHRLAQRAASTVPGARPRRALPAPARLGPDAIERGLRLALLLGVLVALAALPGASARDVHESNSITGPGWHVYGGTTHSLGQKFIMTDPKFEHAEMNRIGVWMDTTSTTGTVCLRFSQTGGAVTSACKPASEIPSSAGYTEFVFASPVAFDPDQYVEFYLDWTGTCTTCMRAYYTDSDSYRTGDSQSAKLTKESGTPWIWSGKDAIFWSNVDHSPVIVTVPARDVTAHSATIVGRNDDDAGLGGTIYFKYGMTTAYGSTTGEWTCNAGSECWIGLTGLSSSTTYHYQACAFNSVGRQCGADQTFTTAWAANNPPSSPSFPVPGISTTGVSLSTGLSWNGGDPDAGDTVTYDVYFDEGTTASTLRCDDRPSSDCPSVSLDGLHGGTTYAWRVESRDNHGALTSGPTWTFTTAVCDAAAPVTLWEHTGHSGGCRSFGKHNGSLPNALFNTGAGMNDAVSSLQVKPGYYALLYQHDGFGGAHLVFSAGDTNLGDDGFDNVASSLRVFACNPNAKAVLFQDKDYDRGCLALDADDLNFGDNVFNNGVQLHNQVTSVWLKEGVQATLFDGTFEAGTPLALLASDTSLVEEGFNDIASSLRFRTAGGPPVNDDHGRPAIVTGPFVYTARESTVAATTQGSETTTCGSTSLGASVWFHFKAQRDGKARVTTGGSDYDTVLAVYSGGGLPATQIVCNDNSASGAQSRLEFTCMKDQVYRIQVGGAGGATGNLRFQLSGCMRFHRDPFFASPADPHCVSSGKRFEVLYVHPNDAPDLYNERVDRIREQVREMNGFLRQDAAMQGGRTADYKVKCTGGVIDVANVFVNVPTTGDIVQALRDHANDYESPEVKYIVWLEKKDDCGFGLQSGGPSSTDAFSASNPINGGPTWIQVFCDDSSHGAAVMMHEAAHGMGGVMVGAPDFDSRPPPFWGHCTDDRSMLCDNDDAGSVCSELRYDCGFDSYFNPNPQASENGIDRHWLFDHWNQGHPYNEFLRFTPGPGNDWFAGRTVIGSAPYTQTLSTAFATHEQSEPSSVSCGWQTNTVWYSFTPPSGGTMTVTTAGSSFDTTLAVFTGTMGSLSLIGCNDNSGGVTSQVSFGVGAGTTYHIQAGGKNGAAGNLQIQLTHTPPNAAPAAPSVTCTPNPTVIGQHLTCSFSSADDSAGVYYTISWGDGATHRIPGMGTVRPGVTQSVGKAYSAAGTYTIRVSATDDGVPVLSSSETTRSHRVAVNTVPGTPSVSCSPNPSVAGQTVECTFSSADAESSGVYYTITWGDGPTTRVPAFGTVAPGTPQTASRAYTSPGAFSMRVTATDNAPTPLTSAAAARTQTVGVTVPYDQGFDGGSPGWTVTNLWHQAGCRYVSAGGSLQYHKPGCPSNFDTGARTSGEATSPAIVIPAGTSPVIAKWKSWHQTQAGTAVDKKLVLVSANDGATWTQLWQEDGPMSTWNARWIDLTPYAGSTVKIRFAFDSVDATLNGGEGWYVDDFAVLKPVAPSAPTSFDASTGTGLGQIRLTWGPPTSDGGAPITNYQLHRSTSASGPFAPLILLGGSTFTHVDSGLTAGQTYYYHVKAVNIADASPASSTDCAKPYPNPLGGC